MRKAYAGVMLSMAQESAARVLSRRSSAASTPSGGTPSSTSTLSQSIPFVKSLLEEDQDGDDKGKKKKGKGKAGKERKRPCPAYVPWCKDQWNEIKKENPEADFKEVSNALGAKWKVLGAEEKRPYEQRYRQDKEAYLQVVGQEKREAEAMKLLEEEQMRWTAKELLEQYLKFRQEAEGPRRQEGEEEEQQEGQGPGQAQAAHVGLLRVLAGAAHRPGREEEECA